ncbi:hypothetical protein R1521_31775 [Rhizobium brockwellii]|uniref:Uncharacterized protein n=1 Tax=Rhizobium brockwellii TaxID=3019932 RepID=A0ABU3YWE6_9HYPH|nr:MULTISPECIES: hypothetical protein [Rhizobium]MDV4183090.1 hypothetical protein [Rhizobium brockwellii]MDV4190027.1 hypothetical protein [Rhizobium brockwellii]TAX87311.1 hypothetical protein ELH95_30990 [Rhizobium leguminosarum]
MTKNGKPSKTQIEQDASGQSESNHAGGSNNEVSSAKPRVITHSDDATVNKNPPGKGKDTKDWDINYNERDMNEGEFRG